MKIYDYNNYIKESFLRDKVDNFLLKRKLKNFKILNYKINSDGTVDVDGDVDLSHEGLTELPVKFGKINGHFDCCRNKLTSLKGSPTNINGDFFCYNNNLSSFEGGPTFIGSNFWCDNNQINSFKGFPSYIGDNFDCNGNPIFTIWKLFRDVDKIELFNEYDIIRGNDIILDRLNDFLITIRKKPLETEGEDGSISTHSQMTHYNLI